jgi:transcriptional regulator with XRE-family HTH domain
MSEDNNKRVQIAFRLREFGLKKYRTLTDFSKALGVKPQTLNNYVSGKTLPGNKMQDKLNELGCDIGWLITGLSRDEMNAKYAGTVKEQATMLGFVPKDEEGKMLLYLSLVGINTVVDLQRALDKSVISEIGKEKDQEKTNQTKESKS